MSYRGDHDAHAALLTAAERTTVGRERAVSELRAEIAALEQQRLDLEHAIAGRRGERITGDNYLHGAALIVGCFCLGTVHRLLVNADQPVWAWSIAIAGTAAAAWLAHRADRERAKAKERLRLLDAGELPLSTRVNAAITAGVAEENDDSGDEDDEGEKPGTKAGK